MKGEKQAWLLFLCHIVLLLVSISSSSGEGGNESSNEREVYIVYMGAAADSTKGSLRSDHAYLLNSLLTRSEKAVVRNYRHGFSGFAARLTKEEADSISQKPGVVSVFPDPILKLHTTRSWDFLKSYQTTLKRQHNSYTSSNSSSSSSDIVIGVLDTGIWPEAASFSDKGMGPIPSRWKGTCMKSFDFNSSHCNRKLIGARYYPDPSKDEDYATPRDKDGHGTHVASIAAGATVSGASYYGLAAGTAQGGFPESRLAVYKVCYKYSCPGSAILAAFDDAIADGVDVVSLSLGAISGLRSELRYDSIAIGAFHAVERGIIVVCSAGNEGPAPNTVVNDAPWMLTVGATTIDRDFRSNLVFAANQVIRGEAINFSPLSNSPNYPLIYSESAKASRATLDGARQCLPDTLDRNKAKGKIVICDGKDPSYRTDLKIQAVKEAGGFGLAHITDPNAPEASVYGNFPATEISSKDATTLLHYVNSTSNPVATILSTVAIMNYKPAPIVASFSARGPATLSKNILKPDIAAPGVNILAAWNGNGGGEVPKGKKRSQFNIDSGTSVACPHVSGLVGRIKSQRPTWSASAIKSAVMTSASQKNTLKGLITTETGSVATPYDYGAGETTIDGPLYPGLVYETSTIDYLNYMCYIGLNLTTIKKIARTIPRGFNCPKDSNSRYISNINYPSIAISNFTGKGAVSVSRTVTNVGEENETVYTPIVDTPSGVTVKLIPNKLQFTKSSKKLSYQVIFSFTSTPLKKDLFGAITWTNGKYNVRSPFVLAI